MSAKNKRDNLIYIIFCVVFIFVFSLKAILVFSPFGIMIFCLIANYLYNEKEAPLILLSLISWLVFFITIWTNGQRIYSRLVQLFGCWDCRFIFHSYLCGCSPLFINLEPTHYKESLERNFA